MKENNNLDLIIEKSKDGYNVAKINKDNKKIYIGSKYNVKREIDNFLNSIDEKIDKKIRFIIFGFGAGEHINELRKKYKENKIMIVEPNKSIMEYAEKTDLVKNDENILLIYCDKNKEMEWQYGKFFNEYNLQDIRIVSFSNYKDIYIEEYLYLCKQIREIYVHHVIERNTRLYFNKRWFETLMNNIPYMVESPLIDCYKNKYNNKPAVIVSSGPSLDKNIGQLKAVEDDFFIISAGRSLLALKNEQIDANLFVSIDSDNLSYEFISEFIEDLKVPLLFTESTNEKILEFYNGYKVCSTYNEAMYSIFSKYSDVNVLTSYGSVAHVMISSAVLLGCNPIILIGQDCAYTDNKAHSPFLEEKQNGLNFEQSKRNSDFYVEDIYGGEVRTNWELNQFRIGIEKIISDNPDITFINATEGGAKIKGATHMKLCEVIDKYKGCEVNELIHELPNNEIKSRTINVMSDMNRGLLYIKKKCNQALELIDKVDGNSINYEKQINYIISKLDKIDKDINKKIKNFILIETLLYPTIYEILVDRSIGEQEDKEKRKDLIIKENIKLYTAINKTIERALKDIKETLSRLRNS